MLCPQTEKYFIKYLEQLYLRIRLAYFYLERVYEHIQQNKHHFHEVKYQPNNMILKFYFSKSFEYMNEVMGENGQYQISFLVNKLSFKQFISQYDKQYLENILRQSAQNVTLKENKADLEDQINQMEIEKSLKYNNRDINDLDILQINVYGSRFNNLTCHEIQFPKEYKMSDDISLIMKYIEQSVYSYSQSQTAFANYNFKLFNKSYYQLIQKYPDINIKQQGSANFILFPQYNINIMTFSKDNPSFYNFDEDLIKKNHQQYNECEQIQETSGKVDSQVDQEYLLKFTAQIYVYKETSTLIIRNIKGEQLYEVKPFSRKHLSLQYQSQICMKMIQQIVFSLLQINDYSLAKQVDLKYYFASRHIYSNIYTKETSTIKVNLDYSNPSSISMLFIIIIEGADNQKISEEFQFEDLVQRFSYQNSISQIEIQFFKSLPYLKKSNKNQQQNNRQDKTFSYEKIYHIFENFVHYAKQQASNETHMYKDALLRTFKCSPTHLQIQTKLKIHPNQK